MNRGILLMLVAAVVLGTSLHVRSQAPLPASPLEALQTIKAQNQKAIDQQTETLKRLDEIHKEASQLRIMARRV